MVNIRILIIDISEQVAKDILGVSLDSKGNPAQRLAIKGGIYPNNEEDLGGYCESALASVVERSLKEQLKEIITTNFTSRGNLRSF